MRGKGTLPLLPSTVGGITPAYAGKSKIIDVIGNINEDHPRLCGEKTDKGDKRIVNEGSPPPMRGKGVNFVCNRNVTGITPAYAGKSEWPIF